MGEAPRTHCFASNSSSRLEKPNGRNSSLTSVGFSFFLLLARCVRGWCDTLLLVKPDTILRWHRKGFRLFWRWKSSRPKVTKQRIPDKVIALIRQMANQNRLWGAERDRDQKYGALFDRVAEGAGIEVSVTAPRTPTMNATCERYLGSARRECLDHIIILGERHLQQVLKEYCLRYFDTCRPHQGLR